MRSAFVGIGQMTHCADVQHPGMSLQINEFDCILSSGTGGDRMRTVVARLAVHPAVTFRHPVQDLILFVAWLMMAGVATRFVQPRVWVLTHLLHASVTVGALHLVNAGHDIPQALGLRTWMALIATVSGVRHLFFVLFVHGFRKVW